jgi:hypothetical protein
VLLKECLTPPTLLEMAIFDINPQIGWNQL